MTKDLQNRPFSKVYLVQIDIVDICRICIQLHVYVVQIDIVDVCGICIAIYVYEVKIDSRICIELLRIWYCRYKQNMYSQLYTYTVLQIYVKYVYTYMALQIINVEYVQLYNYMVLQIIDIYVDYVQLLRMIVDICRICIAT